MKKRIKQKVFDYLVQFYTEIKQYKYKIFKPRKTLVERYGNKL